MIEDMRIRNLATNTQRLYVHYVAGFAKYFHRDPAKLDLEAVRQYQLHLSQERKQSPQSINTFISAVQFLYLVTLEMPWDRHDFPRARLDEKLPVVLAPDEIQRFLDHIHGVKHRAVLLTCYGAGLRISEAVSIKISDIDASSRARAVKTVTPCSPLVCWKSSALTFASCAPAPLAISLLASASAFDRRRRANRLSRSLAA
jgi:site-specific recombinase XerD